MELERELIRRFPSAKLVRCDTGILLSKKFDDGCKVILQISPEGKVVSTYISRMTLRAVLFTEEVKEFLWRVSKWVREKEGTENEK